MESDGGDHWHDSERNVKAGIRNQGSENREQGTENRERGMSRFSFLHRWVSRARAWGLAVAHRRSLETAMELELDSHLEMLRAEFVRKGYPQEEAARRARVAMGGLVTHKEGMRASLGLRWWDEFWADLRFAMRLLRKSPGFTALAVASLALAIGANTTIFSVAKSLLYDRLGVVHPAQLRLLGWAGDDKVAVRSFWSSFDARDAGMRSECFSYPVFRELESHSRMLDGLFAFKDLPMTAQIRGHAQRIRAELISGSYYSVLGVRPQLGRAIQPSDEVQSSGGAVAVISEGLWQREFGRSPDVLGQTILINETALAIVGVNPRGFTGAESVQQSPDVFVPLTLQPLIKPWGRKASLLAQPDNWWLEVMGRLRPGTPDPEARSELDVELAAAVRATLPLKQDATLPRMVLTDGSRGLRHTSQMKQPIRLLFTLVALVLALACANVANLLLARGAHRQREMSVRLAMGAGRGRVLRQMLTESLLLAALGGVVGLLVGYMGRNVIPNLLATHLETAPLEIHFDWAVFAFAATVTLLTGLLFGLAPAAGAARAEVNSGLKEGAQTATRRRRGLGGKALVGFQIALSTLLVIGAGLFLRTLLGLGAIDAGFRTDNLLLAGIDPPDQRYPAGKDVVLHQRLEQALAEVPGVQSVSAMSGPYLAGNMSTMSFVTEAESADPTKGHGEREEEVGNTFFETLKIPILAGRGFGPEDTPSSPKVAVVNQRLARTRFPQGNAIGQRFRMGGPKSEWIQIVGVCADTRYQDLREAPPPQFFIPYVQETEVGGLAYVIRSTVAPSALVPGLREAVAQVDAELPLQDVRTQQAQINETMRMERALAALTSGFGLLALLLACVGVYGIMAYSVANRRNEIGIRMALGAQPRQVRAMILRESTWLAIAGIAVGVGAALLLTRLVKSMLYGVQPHDPLTLTGGVAVLMILALAAGWIPARRAARIQPMDALRHE